MSDDEWTPNEAPIGEIKIGPLLLEIAGKMDDIHKAWKKRGERVFQAPLTGQITGTTTGAPDGGNTTNTNLTTDRGLIYSIRRLSCTGFTAGTVTAYINAIEPIAVWAFGIANPIFVYPKGAMLLQPGDRLTLGANAVTGTALVFGTADAFPVWYLPEYLE